jgi:hypothetical protein
MPSGASRDAGDPSENGSDGEWQKPEGVAILLEMITFPEFSRFVS